MPALSDLLSWADNKRRVVGRNLSDLVENPSDYLTMVAENVPQTVREYADDPMNFVGGGVGRVKLGNTTAPTQAELAGRLRSMGLVDDRGAGNIYRMGVAEKEAVDPELLKLIEDEAIRRGRILPIGR